MTKAEELIEQYLSEAKLTKIALKDIKDKDVRKELTGHYRKAIDTIATDGKKYFISFNSKYPDMHMDFDPDGLLDWDYKAPKGYDVTVHGWNG